MKLSCLICLSLLFATSSFAGGDGTSVGDGGHGVLCHKFSTISNAWIDVVESLDLHEARGPYRSSWTAFEQTSSDMDSASRSPQICVLLESRARRIGRLIGKNHPFLSAF